jgi:hypothetical protein
VKGEDTTKAVKPTAQPAKLTGRTTKRSGIAMKACSTEQSSLLPLEPESAMAKGEAKAITVKIATRRVLFISKSLNSYA